MAMVKLADSSQGLFWGVYLDVHPKACVLPPPILFEL